MRYFSLLITLFCVAMLFITNSSTVMAFCFLGAGLFGFITVLGFAQSKIEANSQSPIAIMNPKELAEMRAKAGANRNTPNRTGQGRGHTANAAAAGGLGVSTYAYLSDADRRDDENNDSGDSDGDGGSDGSGDGGGD